MKKSAHFFARMAGVVIVAALIGSCSGMTMKAYQGSALPGEKVAIIESGAYTQIEAVDGQKVGSRYLSVTASPGSHTVEAAFVRRGIGAKLLYAYDTILVRFRAEAGHRYVVYAAPVAASERVVVMDYDWIVYITDKASGEPVAQSDPAPLRVEHLSPGFFYHNFP